MLTTKNTWTCRKESLPRFGIQYCTWLREVMGFKSTYVVSDDLVRPSQTIWKLLSDRHTQTILEYVYLVRWSEPCLTYVRRSETTYLVRPMVSLTPSPASCTYVLQHIAKNVSNIVKNVQLVVQIQSDFCIPSIPSDCLEKKNSKQSRWHSDCQSVGFVQTTTEWLTDWLTGCYLVRHCWQLKGGALEQSGVVLKRWNCGLE